MGSCLGVSAADGKAGHEGAGPALTRDTRGCIPRPALNYLIVERTAELSSVALRT